MEKNNSHIYGWKAAEKFSADAFKYRLQVLALAKENKELINQIDELKAEIQRLQQIAQY